MAEIDIRVLADSEHRAAHDLARAAHHAPPLPDAQWAYVQDLHEPGLTMGAFAGGALVGTTNFIRSRLSLPGGSTVPMAAATGSAVRADHTRRGVFSRLEHERLTLASDLGLPIVGNLVSEATIYGRFGHGVAALSRAVRLYSREARLRPDAPTGGDVRLIDGESSIGLLPALYERLGPYRPGTVERAPSWWRAKWEGPVRAGQGQVAVVHSGPDGDDGFLVYQTRQNPEIGSHVTLMVTDFHAANPVAVADLWRFLLGLDLVEEICARRRPTDELVEGMLVDWRACRTHAVNDDLWLRIVDVPRALDARVYGDADPVVVDVTDEGRPANSGRYRISPDGAEVVPDHDRSSPAQLSLDVHALAMVYLGTTGFSVLADIGRLRVTDPKALPHADRLFTGHAAAFCGTVF